MGDVLFIDSIQFLQGKLSDLTKDVLRDDADWKYAHEAVQHEPRLAKFMRMKLPFPYTYFDSEEKLKVEEMPPIEEFNDTLRDEECSEKDYAIVKEIWEIVGNFRGLHDAYLAFDVLQLCCIFEKFREETRSQFELDPIHYYTLPVSISSLWEVGGLWRGVEGITTHFFSYFSRTLGTRCFCIRVCVWNESRTKRNTTFSKQVSEGV